MVLKELLKELCETPGISGYEDKIRDIIRRELRKDCFISTDVLGNVIAEKRGKGSHPKLMFVAHMDEVGLVITCIEKEGFLRFNTIGTIDEKVLPDKKVIVHGKQDYVGIIGCKPPHLQEDEEKKQVIKMENLFIDLGAKDEKEVETLGVGKGTIASLQNEFDEMLNGKYVCKAMDNRASVAVLIELLKSLKEFKGTIFGVFSSQEETGLKGARTAAFKLNPDVAIVLDVAMAGDTPEVKKHESEGALGKGPAITVMEAEGRGAMIPQKIRELIINAAKKNKIPYQISLTCGGMTDAATIQLIKEGIPTGVFGPATRYLHEENAIVDKDDLDNTLKLAKAVVHEAPSYF